MKMGEAETKGDMKTGLEALNVILFRLNLDMPRMSIIFDTKWSQFVGQVEFEGHRLQSKGTFLKVVRDDLCDQMILVTELLKGRILGSRIPDIFQEYSGHFWLRPEYFWNFIIFS